MYQTHHFKDKFILFLKIFFPILIYQFANYSASFVDTTMTGQYNTMDLAGVSMATSIWNPFFTFLTGIVSALVPSLVTILDEEKRKKLRLIFTNLFIWPWAIRFFTGTGSFLGTTSFESYWTRSASSSSSGSLSLVFIYRGLSPCCSLVSFVPCWIRWGLTKLSMYLMLLLLPFNSGFNYLLIFGAFGVPELGGCWLWFRYVFGLLGLTGYFCSGFI